MSLSQRWTEIRSGFEPAFWVANVSELFERFAYYGVFASLAIYLHESLRFSVESTANLAGLFGGLVWFLAILGGTAADRLGFRRALSLAYLILTIAYFLLGSLGASWMASVRSVIPLWWLVLIVLCLPALGVSMVKPCVVGTTAHAADEKVRSMGYTIYYFLVNVGSAIGPWVAGYVHEKVGVENVFRVSALAVLAMLIAVQLFFRDTQRSRAERQSSLAGTLRNLGTIFSNGRFILFLLIFSIFWVAYWQEFITLGLYIHAYVSPTADVERILMTDATTVILFQFLVSYLTRKMGAFRAVNLGALVGSLGWLIIGTFATTWAAVAAIFVVALGEVIFSPRYYEYVSRLAPAGQQGTYMGFAFVPIGIGSLVGGPVGGHLYHHFTEVVHKPREFWWVITGIGLLSAVLLWIYDAAIKPAAATAPAS